MTRTFYVGIVLLFLSITPVYAQSVTGFERDLILTLTPAIPHPNQIVQLSIQATGLDLNRSVVVWSVNDEEVARGVGLTETSITIGGPGKESHILVMAEDDQGLIGSAETTIHPTEVDLLWEALSYTHPFYGGRALPGAKSPIRAHALARFQTPGGTVPNSDIIYTWYRDERVVAEGRGKSTMVLDGPDLFGSITIRVIAESADRSLKGGADVRLSSIDPSVLVYENHPLFGILFHRALEGSVHTLETEQKVTAVPYFASILSPYDPLLVYEWKVNNSTLISDPNESQTLMVATRGYSGPANIALTLTSSSDILLQATKEFELIFGSDASAFFSSLNPFGSGE